MGRRRRALPRRRQPPRKEKKGKGEMKPASDVESCADRAYASGGGCGLLRALSPLRLCGFAAKAPSAVAGGRRRAAAGAGRRSAARRRPRGRRRAAGGGGGGESGTVRGPGGHRAGPAGPGGGGGRARPAARPWAPCNSEHSFPLNSDASRGARPRQRGDHHHRRQLIAWPVGVSRRMARDEHRVAAAGDDAGAAGGGGFKGA